MGPGGGVLIGINDLCPINLNHIYNPDYGEIIALDLTISGPGFSFTFCVYYHRPLHRTVDDIIKWYNDFITPNVIIVGDFNLPAIDWATKSLKHDHDINMHTSFLDFVNCNNLNQSVLFPTHKLPQH